MGYDELIHIIFMQGNISVKQIYFTWAEKHMVLSVVGEKLITAPGFTRWNVLRQNICKFLLFISCLLVRFGDLSIHELNGALIHVCMALFISGSGGAGKCCVAPPKIAIVLSFGYPANVRRTSLRSTCNYSGGGAITLPFGEHSCCFLIHLPHLSHF